MSRLRPVRTGTRRYVRRKFPGPDEMLAGVTKTLDDEEISLAN